MYRKQLIFALSLLLIFIFHTIALANIKNLETKYLPSEGTTIGWESSFWTQEFKAGEIVTFELNWKVFEGAADFSNFLLKRDVMNNPPKPKNDVDCQIQSLSIIDENRIQISILSENGMNDGKVDFFLILQIDQDGDGFVDTEKQYGVNLHVGGEMPKELLVTLKVDQFGRGFVSSNDSGILCGEDCEQAYPPGTIVKLSASPDTEWGFMHWVGCDEIVDEICQVTMDSNKLVTTTFKRKKFELMPETKILSDNSLNLLKAMDDTSLQFGPGTSQVENLQPGDVLISKEGQGFLRKVKAVTIDNNGEVFVETEQGKLVDAIKEGTVAFKKKLTSSDIVLIEKHTQPAPSFILKSNTTEITQQYVTNNLTSSSNNELISLNVNENIGGLQIKGDVGFEFEIEAGLDVGWESLVIPVLEEFKCILHTGVYQKLTIQADYALDESKQWQLYTLWFTPITAGPVVFTPKITIYFDIEAGVTAALTMSNEAGVGIAAGVRYLKGDGWHGVWSLDKIFRFDPPAIEGSATAKASLGPEMSLLLYGLVGPYVDLLGYIRGDAFISGGLLWELYAGVESNAGAKVEVLGYTLVDWDTSLFRQEWLLASNSRGSLTISPVEAMSMRGLTGGPFLPESKTYTISNIGSQGLTVNIDQDRDFPAYWLNTSVESLTLLPGENYEFVLSYNGGVDDYDFPNLAGLITAINKKGYIEVESPYGLGDTFIPAEIRIDIGSFRLLFPYNDDESPYGLPPASVDQNYQYTFEARNGFLPYTYNIEGNIPLGMAASGQRLLGVPETPGDYYLFVTAEDNAGRIDTKEYKLVVYDNLPPEIPLNLEATTHSSSEINLTWDVSNDDSNKVVSYIVSRSNGPSGEFFDIFSRPIIDNNFLDEGLDPGGTYCYQVQAIDPDNPEKRSSPSNIDCDTTFADLPPEAPTGISADPVSDTEIQITWNEAYDDVGIMGYQLYGDGVRLNDTLISSLSWADKGLSPLETYCYTVQAIDLSNNVSPLSEEVCTKPLPDQTPPKPVLNLMVESLSFPSIKATWDHTSDNGAVAGYTLVRDMVRIGDFAVDSVCVNPDMPGTACSLIDEDLEALTKYCYSVHAYDTEGNLSNSISPPKCTETFAPYCQLKNVSVTKTLYEFPKAIDLFISGYYYQKGVPTQKELIIQIKDHATSAEYFQGNISTDESGYFEIQTPFFDPSLSPYEVMISVYNDSQCNDKIILIEGVDF